MGLISRVRPFPMGISIGHYLITAGTAGCVVEIGDKAFILSNNHVFANSNNAQIGDKILQPGPYDGGVVDNDVVGLLYKFVPLKFSEPSTCPVATFVMKCLNAISYVFRRKTRFYIRVESNSENQIDCAIMEPFEGVYKPEINEVGLPKGSARVTEGETVRKSGRTTGLTTGTVVDDDVMIDVSYGTTTAKFVHQILVTGTHFIEGGDSGSALLNKDDYVVGLCFAGSGDGSFGIANHINYVEEGLGVKVKAF